MSRQTQEVYVVAACRTAVGKARGVFRHTRPDNLLSHVLKDVVDKVPQLDPMVIDDVIIGCAMPEAEQGMNVARIGVLMAGLPESIPAVTVNRFCSSGLQTVAMAVDRIAAGAADLIIAGGTESMSMVPNGGYHYRANPAWFADHEKHADIAFGMGITAEKVAKQWQISRDMQDAYSFESHQRALRAMANNEFKHEISPFTVVAHYPDLQAGQVIEKSFIVDQDEGPRPDTSLEKLASLRPVFAAQGTVTAGSSSQMSDGAAAIILASAKMVKEHNLTPLARLHSFAVAGVPPEIMGIGPIKAIPKALAAAGKTLADIEWIELNEAFAAQTLAVMQELALDPAIVNPLGGAIAQGHPLGATGAIRSATLIHGLRRHSKTWGLVTMCIGTGMGAAGVFEVL